MLSRLASAFLTTVLLAACGAAPPPPAPHDTDGDGLVDRDDTCPERPEDLDGFEDEDGCTDLDDDSDGVADVDDLCRCHAEDADGFEDADGCPDPDDDQDRIADACDRCPREPELYNGTCDDDGCPDRGRLVCVEAAQLRILDRVRFPRHGARVSGRHEPLLDAVADTLRANPQIELVALIGHASPDERAPEQLARRRVDAVYRALLGRGVEPTRLQVEVAPVSDAGADASLGGDESRSVSFAVRRVEGRQVEGRAPSDEGAQGGCGTHHEAGDPIETCAPVPDCDPTPRDPEASC